MLRFLRIFKGAQSRLHNRSSNISLMSSRIRQLLPAQFKDLYANVPPRISADVYRFFELSIRYMEGNTPKVYDYAIQHLMLRSSGDAHMDTWARQQKLFPWVAIAAQLNVSLSFLLMFVLL